ncbi:helix-turn-helix domain-containing protein [Algoriphagus aestuariicola]|uniref:Helix-turn-helix domain-containing protein n=1 Tax=Algoriphagus aestuariicola TaxID=1852016 RepID=A0ABS3BSM3_9BACT|nr:helix-turn-helix domain-containing protein [Algoriphagus aestuariicola]MBN7801871.1 helix-turn-helix domain-containing protein [Algoriphagus aestuariicola]
MTSSFDESRNEFKPYGLTCEKWVPSFMKKPDRHNEIEINYFPEEGITYLFQGRKVIPPPRRITVFWGLVPHQIIDFEKANPYYVCTVPLSLFLEWKLSTSFVDSLLKGEVLFEDKEENSKYDEFLFKNWLNDINGDGSSEVALLEIHARLCRMSVGNLNQDRMENLAIQPNDISHVEQIAVFIAQNYSEPIKVSDIGKAVGLHPDHANSIFKKTFGSTLSEYITEERISHAQRKLVATDKSITDIVFDCGFNSISRFNAAFQKINKCTPREYRKSYLLNR